MLGQARQRAHHVAEGLPRGGVPPDRATRCVNDRCDQPDAAARRRHAGEIPPPLAGRARSAGVRVSRPAALRAGPCYRVAGDERAGARMRIDGFPILWFDNDADRQRAHRSPEMAECNVDSRLFIGAVSRVMCEPRRCRAPADDAARIEVDRTAARRSARMTRH